MTARAPLASNTGTPSASASASAISSITPRQRSRHRDWCAAALASAVIVAALLAPPRGRTSIYAMDRISTSKARKDFRNVIRRASAEGKRVKITHYGKTLAGLISAKDLAVLENCESVNARGQVKKPARRR